MTTVCSPGASPGDFGPFEREHRFLDGCALPGLHSQPLIGATDSFGSFAPTGLDLRNNMFPGLRPGLHSVAAPRLNKDAASPRYSNSRTHASPIVIWTSMIQNMYLRATCISRILVRVVRIWPKLGEVRLGSGLPQFGWFGKLKASNRNWTVCCSAIRKSLWAEKSHWMTPGVMIVLRPAFPKVPKG